jgi:hypothetical protein
VEKFERRATVRQFIWSTRDHVLSSVMNVSTNPASTSAAST